MTIPLEFGGESRKTITSRYDSATAQVLTTTLSGTLGSGGSFWTAPWIKFEYTDADVLCIEKLTVSDTVFPALSYNIVQDYDPNAFDVVASDPGWTSATNQKVVHFANDCNYDSGRPITQVNCSAYYRL